MSAEATYIYEDRIPSPEEYISLRRHCGFPRPYAPDLLRTALPKSIYSVVVRDQVSGESVGMGRIIGDGIFMQVTDIVVDKEHQGRGIGKGIMGRIAAYLEANAQQGSYVSLLADGQAYKLYQQYGFKLTGDASLGMFRRF